MKTKTEILVDKIMKHLLDHEYSDSKTIAKKLGVSSGTVFRIIRVMRVRRIGILTTNKGYILSEFASKKDDVNFLRRLYARRLSDYHCVKAAEPTIKRRWKSIAEKQQLSLIFKPLDVDIGKTQGSTLMVKLSKDKKLGI